jgi:serine protease Do
MKIKSGIAIGAGILIVVLAAALGFHSAFVKNRSIQDRLEAADQLSETQDRTFETLAKQVQGSVVNIIAQQITANSALFPDRFGELFGDNRLYAGTKEKNLGSGFIVNSSGFILTNSHIVESASRIRVKLNDNRVLDAVVVGSDPKSDLAVLKIGANNLPALRFAHSNNIKVGEWVAAFGSPFGLDKTITAGIISAKGRATDKGLALIQTDAAINPGNSGGPLVDLRGEVVGINIIIGGSGRYYSGIGFAIPSDAAQQIYNELTKSGKSKRGWIGVRMQEVTHEITKNSRLSESEGAVILELAPDGPALKAGLRPGDIIIEYNHRPFQSSREFTAAVMDTRIGTSIPMRIVRDGKDLAYNVLVGERPSSIAERFHSPGANDRGRIGITIENVTPEIQSYFHLSSREGVIVVEVAQGSSAEDGGVQPGDVIHQINRLAVHSANDLIAALQNLGEDSTVLLGIERQGSRFYLALQLE